ncbi:MAG: ABC transporter ATP-binding protein [Oscillospiraceae bacterium]|nr:ABC transporter ATP-binding protein [Oscillospiraceae bacterium]
MIKCRNVVKKFYSGKEFFAVNDVSFEIQKGEFVAVIGKSGSGKSTLMNMIGLIERPSSGDIFIDGENVQNMTDKQLAVLRNKKIGYIFQAFHLEHLYPVYHNVEMPLLISDVPTKARKNRVEECLKAVGLEEKANELAGNLSGGEKQRVCIARALANDPEIILADEPCGNLDSENTKNIMNILKELNENGKTVVLITHNMDEARTADRIIYMKDGKIGENTP